MSETRVSGRDKDFTFVTETTREVVAAWIDRVYRPERLSRDSGTRKRIIDDRLNDLCAYGGAVVSLHDANSGRVQWLVTSTDGDSQSSEVGD